MDEPKRTALIYDFDGTLARGNLQETSFIPNIGMTKEDFWAEVRRVRGITMPMKSSSICI